MYVLGNSPRTPNEAFDALNNVFGAEELFGTIDSQLFYAVGKLTPVIEPLSRQPFSVFVGQD